MGNRVGHQLTILDLLKASPGGVTSRRLAAVTWRFSARLFDLREKGYKILTKATENPAIKVYVYKGGPHA